MSQEILKWHREFTMISSLDLTGKLPFGAAEMYGIVEHEAQQLNISYFIIGATARDIILYHGFNAQLERGTDRKSTRLNSSHVRISYAVFCLKKKIKKK